MPAAAPLTGMTRHDVTAGEHRLRVFEAGAGPEAVVLVHGIPDSPAIYRHQIPALVEAGYRVVAPDLLGQGDSNIPTGPGHYAVAKDEERLWAVLDALGVGRFHLVGHDRGAPAT